MPLEDHDSRSHPDTTFKSEIDKSREEEYLEIQTREARLFPKGRYFLVFLTILGISLLLVLAGGKATSVIGVECGTWQYWMITFLV